MMRIKKYKRKFEKRLGVLKTMPSELFISVNIAIVIRPVRDPSSFLSLRSFEMKHKER